MLASGMRWFEWYDVQALCSPQPEEWAKMQQTLEDLLENQEMNTSLS